MFVQVRSAEGWPWSGQVQEHLLVSLSLKSATVCNLGPGNVLAFGRPSVLSEIETLVSMWLVDGGSSNMVCGHCSSPGARA